MKCLIVGLLTLAPAVASAETCIASVYDTAEAWGSRTASGIRLRNEVPSIAHRTYALRGWMRVTNRKTGKVVQLQVIDRGPYKAGRCVDLSKEAGRQLACNGLCPVIVEPLGEKK